MRSLSTTELLFLWEEGLSQSPMQWALTAINAVRPEYALEQIGQVNVGQRDVLLLNFREQVFGSQLAGVTQCPVCDDRLELSFQISEIRTAIAPEPDEILEWQEEGYDVQFRLPNGLDLAIIERSLPTSADVLRQHLLERCLLQVHYNGVDQAIASLPPSLIERIEARMAEADPQADVQLDLLCPSCQHRWQVAFDIVSFFWSELNAWAHRLLREVHLLASAYGWSEADILTMSTRRRQLYVEMVI